MSLFEFPIAGPNAYFADTCIPEDITTPRFTTENGVEYVRTPEEAFADLADNGYPWKPNYAQIDGMRMHYIDAGPKDAEEVVLLLHGQPSWSYLYRKMIPVFEQSGIRALALDWLGMGRSDKPVELSEHTYLKQVQRLKDFIMQVLPQAMEEPLITLFIQDWGSLIGFRVAGDEPQWFRRIVSANGVLPLFPTGFNPMTVDNPVNINCSDTRSFLEMALDRQALAPCGADQSCFSIWIDYALTSPSLRASDVLDLATFVRHNDGELAQYDAPYPEYIYMAAIRAFPSMIAGVHEPEFGNIDAWASLGNFTRPYLSLAGELDGQQGSPETQAALTGGIPGSSVHDFEHRRYPNASHFIQDDVGVEMAEYVVEFIEGTPVGDSNEESGIDDSSASFHGGFNNIVVVMLVISLLRKMVSL